MEKLKQNNILESFYKLFSKKISESEKLKKENNEKPEEKKANQAEVKAESNKKLS